MVKQRDAMPTMEDFAAYLKVRREVLDMSSPEARAATGLKPAVFVAVVQNYEALRRRYPEVR